MILTDFINIDQIVGYMCLRHEQRLGFLGWCATLVTGAVIGMTLFVLASLGLVLLSGRLT